MNEDDKAEERTEYFADATAEENQALHQIVLEIQALDHMLEVVMNTHITQMRIYWKDSKKIWDRIEQRLREQWPTDHSVLLAPDGKLYRKPGSHSDRNADKPQKEKL